MSYSGYIILKDVENPEALAGIAQIPFSFDVKAGSPGFSNNGVAVMFSDEASSYAKQMEINNYLRSIDGKDHSLSNSYIDYYLTKSTGAKPVIDVWYTKNNVCHKVYRCGESDNYVIRQYLKDEWNVKSEFSYSTSQIGYREQKNGKDSDIYGDKYTTLNSQAEEQRDYSYSNPASNYQLKAYERNAHYNPFMSLHANDGTLLYGTVPSWMNSTCREAVPSVDYITNTTNTEKTEYWCDEIPSDPPEISFETEGPDVIYEGEDYFARPNIISSSEVTVSLGENAPAWLEVGTPADYWSGDYYTSDNKVDTEKNRKIIYIRSKHGSIRQTKTITPGTYSYTIKVQDASGKSSSVQRTITVLDGLNHPKNSNSGLAVLMGDETWFKKYQLDIATGIVNYSDKNVNLENFYYDYYGQIDKGSMTSNSNQLREWYTANNMTVSFSDCGNDRFRVRYQYKGTLGIPANGSVLDNKAGFVYSTGSVMNKTDDFSLLYFGADPESRRYNYYMPLYNGDGKILWGKAPNWADECKEMNDVESSASIPDPSTSSSCSNCTSIGTSSSVPPVITSSTGTQVPHSSAQFNPIYYSSSSSVDIFRDLAVRFLDNNRESQSAVQMYMDIVNKGTQNASIDGYKVRFYYNDTRDADASSLAFELYYNGGDQRGDGIFAEKPHTVKCAADKYALEMTFADNVSVPAGGHFPNGQISGALYDWSGKYNKSEFFSWQANEELNENSNMALFDAKGNLVYGREAWKCDGYTEKELKIKVSEKINSEENGLVGRVELKIKNVGDLDYEEPLYVNFYVTHTNGQVPVISSVDKKLVIASANLSGAIANNVNVVRKSAGNKHTFVFALPNGLKASEEETISFLLSDACTKDCDNEAKNLFRWDFSDDWSAQDGNKNLWNFVVTKKVIVLKNNGEKIYGEPDPSAPIADVVKISTVNEPEPLKQPRAEIDAMRANRTDAVAYSGGQLLSGGDFEDDYIRGWDVSGSAVSVRGICPQGSRYLTLNANSSIAQEISSLSFETLKDSGATLTFWAKGGSGKVTLLGEEFTFTSGSSWSKKTFTFDKDEFEGKQDLDMFIAIVSQGSDVSLDDAILVPGVEKPVTYATRFTNMANEEIETRAYDGEKEQIVTSSERDAMGREWKKYLPYAMLCNGVVQCNSDIKSLYNPAVAEEYYVADNPNYPDAQGVAYTQTEWKPDPMATKDVVANPGIAYSLLATEKTENGSVKKATNYMRAFSSGVNMVGVDSLNIESVSKAVTAVQDTRKYQSIISDNYHAKADENPTHLWELTIDPDGRTSFSVKNGEGLVLISGAMKKSAENDKEWIPVAYSLNMYDDRGNLVKSHSPMSCEYAHVDKGSCVTPTTYVYDEENHVVESVEPDAGTTRSFYDDAGRLRATQTQNQIDRSVASVSIYDDLDRVKCTGEWTVPSGFDHGYFKKSENMAMLKESDLVEGTISRMFYDDLPATSYGVTLYPSDVNPAEEFKYSRGRLVATISDVGYNEKNEIVRVSSVNSYDKYGRVLATYTYDASLPDELDSLRMMVVKNEYDIGGKLLASTKYPYGVSSYAKDNRGVSELYRYDRLGRVESILVKNGTSNETELASYSYYPTGSVRTIKLGNSLTIDYTYHISGAVKKAVVKNAKGETQYSEELFYEDSENPQYNGNISRMVHELAVNGGKKCDTKYVYDFMNRLEKADDEIDQELDEMFAYDNQGRIVKQTRWDKDKQTQEGMGGV